MIAIHLFGWSDCEMRREASQVFSSHFKKRELLDLIGEMRETQFCESTGSTVDEVAKDDNDVEERWREKSRKRRRNEKLRTMACRDHVGGSSDNSGSNRTWLLEIEMTLKLKYPLYRHHLGDRKTSFA